MTYIVKLTQQKQDGEREELTQKKQAGTREAERQGLEETKSQLTTSVVLPADDLT